MKNQKIKNSKKKNSFQFMKQFSDYMKENYAAIILLFVTLVISCVVSFFKISTTSTVATYNIEEYEVGQIADITIKATKTLPPTFESPVSVEKDEKIIKKGFPITEEQYAKLKKMAETSSYFDGRAFANAIVYHILVMMFMYFFFCSPIFFNKKLEFKELITECVFYLLIYIMAAVAGKTVRFSDPFGLGVIIPSSFCTMLISILFGQLNAVFFSIISSLGVLNASSYQIIPFLYILSTSICSVRIVRNIQHRSSMVLVSFLQMMLNLVFLFIFKLIFNYPLRGSVIAFTGVAANGFMSGILCLGMITPFEILLNTASPFRLTDLSDTSNEIFEEMKVKANGTYSHCQNVATLAEAACREIGANSLLARVGAQYHDIGKIDNPEYFTENQIDGYNVHDKINPSLSASIIRSHVKRGVEKAHELHLPAKVVDIISQHHGNQLIEFFYKAALEKDANTNRADYSYTGNPPDSKESAVVMLADTIEAATRTLKNKSVPSLDKFIWLMINKKIESHQLLYCNLTFVELTKIHDSFLTILTGIYHSRIEYPDQKENEAKIEKAVQNGVSSEIKLVSEKESSYFDEDGNNLEALKYSENDSKSSENKAENKSEDKAQSENSGSKKSDLKSEVKAGEEKSDSKKDKTGDLKTSAKKDKTGEFKVVNKKDKTGEFKIDSKKDKTESKKNKTGEFKIESKSDSKSENKKEKNNGK